MSMSTLAIGFSEIEQWLCMSREDVGVNTVYRLVNPKSKRVYYLLRSADNRYFVYNIEVVGRSGYQSFYQGVEYEVVGYSAVKTGGTRGELSTTDKDARWGFENFAVN